MRGLSITGAAIHADIPRRTVYDWRDADAEFRAAWDEALEYGSDRLEDEAFRRAHDGVERPLVSAGKVVKDDDGVALRIREYSDTLMCLLLKSRRPGFCPSWVERPGAIKIAICKLLMQRERGGLVRAWNYQRSGAGGDYRGFE